MSKIPINFPHLKYGVVCFKINIIDKLMRKIKSVSVCNICSTQGL